MCSDLSFNKFKKINMVIRILLLTMLPFVCLGQITPREGNSVNNGMNEPGNVEIKRKTSYNLDEIKVRWKKAALENCPGVPCVVAPSFTCVTNTVSDIDGNTYNTVLIGTQCWTKENLKVTKYNNNDPIPDSTNSTWGTVAIGALTEYIGVGVPAGGYVGTYGYLYDWYVVNDSRKLCPSGWHVPTDAEWTNLSTYLGGESVAGGKMKVMGTTLWNTQSVGTDNSSVFSALPGGYRDSNGDFNDIRYYAFFWSAKDNPSGSAWFRSLDYNLGSLYRGGSPKKYGFSVRCLRD
jgi:uncharacterized protein (TIGR02145 family)